MAGHLSVDSAYRAIKRGEAAPVYTLTGTEDVLKDELVALVRERLLDPATREFNFDVRSAADLDGERLHALVETPPMLADRRVVVLRNPEQWRANAKVWQVLERYLENPSRSTILLLVYGPDQKPHAAVARHSVVVDVGPLNPERLRRWVTARAERAGVQIAEDATHHLLGAVGPDLSQLAAEIEKLAAACGGARPVGAEDVAALVGIRRGETPYDWAQAALARDIPRAIDLLGPVLAASGVSGVRLLSLLGTMLVGLRSARAMLDAGTPPGQAERALLDLLRSARPPGLRGWRDEAAAWVATARRWSAADLDAAIQAAYDADRILKSTTVSDERGILTDMLLRLSGLRAAA